MTGGSSSNKEGGSKRVCTVCGQDVSPSENVCPHCGNVFRKEEGEWEWKLIPREQKIRRRKTDENEEE